MALVENTYELKISMIASKASAGLARTMTTPKLQKWGYTGIVDDAHLIMSELIANAAQAAPGTLIWLRLRRDATGVLLEVWDSSPHVPKLKPLAAHSLDSLDISEESWDDNGGWGLHIVMALSVDCGYRLDPAGGKWVWARLKPC